MGKKAEKRMAKAVKIAKRDLMQQVANTPSISLRRAESIAEKIGAKMPDDSERRWDSAKTHRLNQAHWSGANGQPINTDLASWLDVLRNRSEKEGANNPLVEGMITTYQLCVNGSEGPRLSITTKDTEYALQRARIWEDFCQSAGCNQQQALVDIIDMWIRSCFFAGEFLDQIVSVPDVEGPIKTRLLPIAARRLMTPPEMLGDPEVAMGVRRDLRYRRPTHYYVSQPYIMGAFEVYTGEFLEIPYADAIHGYRMIEEDQVRGVPWLASCLDAIGELRDFKIETLDAARAAADMAVLLHTEHVDAPYIQTNEETHIQRRTIRNLPPGWQANMVQPAHPGPQYDSFYESLAREHGASICMPLMMLLLDSSSHNYSSARFDGQIFWRGVAKTQGFIGRPLLRLESAIALEAELAGELPPPPADLRRRLNWPTAPHVDPTKERTADRMGLENGDLSYTELCAKNGRTRDEMIAERKADNDALEAADLPTIPGIPITGAPAGDANQDAPAGDKPKNDKAQNGNANGANRLSEYIDDSMRDWVTLDSGAHVDIGADGTIEKGPPGMVGAKPADLSNAHKASAKAHEKSATARPQGRSASSEQHEQAAKDHRDAQQAHKDAAEAHSKIGTDQAKATSGVHKYSAQQHKQMAIHHEKMAKAMKASNRTFNGELNGSGAHAN